MKIKNRINRKKAKKYEILTNKLKNEIVEIKSSLTKNQA